MTSGIVLLAGGEARRLPGKLALDVGGVPLVVRSFRNALPAPEIVVSCQGSFAPQIDAALQAPFVVDRWRRRGPLAGLVSAMLQMRSRRIVALAADAPFLGAWLVEALESAWRDGDEAVVPIVEAEGERRPEPLAALYDRLAFLREAGAELRRRASVASVLQRLRVRFVEVADPSALRSVNEMGDYAALCSRVAPC